MQSVDAVAGHHFAATGQIRRDQRQSAGRGFDQAPAARLRGNSSATPSHPRIAAAPACPRRGPANRPGLALANASTSPRGPNADCPGPACRRAGIRCCGPARCSMRAASTNSRMPFSHSRRAASSTRSGRGPAASSRRGGNGSVSTPELRITRIFCAAPAATRSNASRVVGVLQDQPRVAAAERAAHQQLDDRPQRARLEPVAGEHVAHAGDRIDHRRHAAPSVRRARRRRRISR